MADRENQLPWEDEPYQDQRSAQQRALNAAQWQAPELLTSSQRSYARKAFEREIDALQSQAQGSRNHELNKAAFNLAQLVAAGALDETEVRQALYEACRSNGHLQDDGQHMVLGTIESGFEGGLKSPRDLSHVTGNITVDLNSDEPKAKAQLSLADIESGFWTKRDSLQSIYLGALSRMCSPWAVLAHCAARALTLVPPRVFLPPLIGGEGSLNWFAAIVAKSGDGKGSSAKAAKVLVNEPVMTRNLGSGEGMIDAFVKPANKETGEPAGMHKSIMFMAEEVDNMHALGSRTGATLMPILRSAFSGETIGFSYRSNSLHLEAQSYRATLVVSLQPKRGGALLDDQYGGTLQRFMWFPADDPRIDEITPPEPGSLTLPSYLSWQYPIEVKVPYIARHLIKRERARAMRGEQDHLDGHALFIREKFAYALAVLDGRSEMTEDDWRLAGIASRVSEHTRQWVIEDYENHLRKDAEKRGQLLGVSSAAADEEKASVAQERSTRIWKWILKKLSESPNGKTKRELRDAINSRDRPFFQTIFDAMSRDGFIEQNPEKRWVRSNA